MLAAKRSRRSQQAAAGRNSPLPMSVIRLKWARVFGEFAATEKRVDILVNAAGLLSTVSSQISGADEWRRASQVNLAGVLYCAKAAIPIMSKQRYGRIINIASVSAMRGGGSVGNTLYGATPAWSP